MSSRTCPVPNCTLPVPGPNGVFCAEHYFQLEPNRTRMIMRMQIECRRCEDAQRRAYLADQLGSYIAVAVRKLQERNHAA